jgi:hypothetical protein
MPPHACVCAGFCLLRRPLTISAAALQALAFRTYLAEGRLIRQSEVELAEIEECESR